MEEKSFAFFNFLDEAASLQKLLHRPNCEWVPWKRLFNLKTAYFPCHKGHP
jgi:hypothetical protein